MRDPTISVLMSVYNAEATIEEAVTSILNQSFRSFEFIIFEDCSTDGTRDILRRFEDERLDVRYLDENQGLTRNLVKGVADAAGDFIARMDADDISLPDRFQKQLKFFEEFPDIDVLGTNVIFFDGAGYEALGMQPETHDEIESRLFFGFTMMHPTVMMRGSAVRGGGWNYDPEFTYSEDHDLWVRMIRHHRFANLQEPLLMMREHPAKMTRSHRSSFFEASNKIRRRQVAELLSEIDEREFSSFCRAASGQVLESLAELALLDVFLQRLLRENSLRGIYQIDRFEKSASNFFRSKCRQGMKRGAKCALLYFNSPLRHMVGTVSVWERAKFFLISIQSFFYFK